MMTFHFTYLSKEKCVPTLHHTIKDEDCIDALIRISLQIQYSVLSFQICLELQEVGHYRVTSKCSNLELDENVIMIVHLNGNFTRLSNK